jgi:hypothetical protein
MRSMIHEAEEVDVNSSKRSTQDNDLVALIEKVAQSDLGPLDEPVEVLDESAEGGQGANRVGALEARATVAQAKAEANSAPGYSHLGSIDVTDLRQQVIDKWARLWGDETQPWKATLEGELRSAPKLFPGVQHERLMFSADWLSPRLNVTATPSTSVITPAFRELQGALHPVLEELLLHRMGVQDWQSKVLRVQLNRIPKGAKVRRHRDSGWYAYNSHRIHVPLIVPKCVHFLQGSERQSEEDEQASIVSVLQAGKVGHTSESAGEEDEESAVFHEIPFKEGEAFEVHNVMLHQVLQTGPYDRVTMIIDLLETPRDRLVELNNQCLDTQELECFASLEVPPEVFTTKSHAHDSVRKRQGRE